MKPLFIFLLLTLGGTICFSQRTRINKRQGLNPNNVVCSFQINEKNKPTGKLPFQKILFYDVRYDTTCIAIKWQVNSGKKVGRNFNTKLNLTNGLSAGFTDYFNKFYKDNISFNNAQLVCFVKKFSITLNSLPTDRLPEATVSDVNVELECYYKRDSLLFPAIRFDTTYQQINSRINQTFSESIGDMILPFIDRVNKIDSAAIVKRNSYPEEQIQKRYQSRFSVPILTTDHYVKGVYKNFNEFINNTPSITGFKVKNLRKGRVALYDSADNNINTFEIFGFSDGNTCWIEHAAYCYPLVKFDNSFEFLYQVNTEPLPTFNLLPLKIRLLPLNIRLVSLSINHVFPTHSNFLSVLNMESGKIY